MAEPESGHIDQTAKTQVSLLGECVGMRAAHRQVKLVERFVVCFIWDLPFTDSKMNPCGV